MAVIWGLDLKEIQWGKFKSKYMFDRKYVWRPTKFVVYQLAMIFGIVSDALGQDTLGKYRKQQDYFTRTYPGAYEFNNDIIGAASFNTFATTYTAIIFGSGFFFDLIWPERHETKAVRWAWIINAVFATLCQLGDAIALNIVVASHSATLSNVDPVIVPELLAEYPKPYLEYHRYPKAVTSVVFCWLCAVSTIASAIVLIISIRHNDKWGGHIENGTANKDEETVTTETKPVGSEETRRSGEVNGGANGVAHGA